MAPYPTGQSSWTMTIGKPARLVRRTNRIPMFPRQGDATLIIQRMDKNEDNAEKNHVSQGRIF
jgi:hypothetical protein